MTQEEKKYYMNEAIKEAYKGIDASHGGPFGAIIVRDGEIVGRGHNQVLKNNDPTCHGEMQAIRDACDGLQTFDLSGCELFTTGEPCTMCLCASMWANIDHIYYACTIEDNDMIGFRDDKFNDIFGGKQTRENLKNYLECICREEGLVLFEDYNKRNAQRY